MSLVRKDLIELYGSTGQQLFHCALAVTNSSDLAEDAVHDAFMRAFRIEERPQNLKAYMFRAVRNAAVDILRRQARTVQPGPDQVFDVAGPDERELETSFDLEEVYRTLRILPDDQRETILQHLVAGLTFREIAELRERPMGTIVTWYRRGIEVVRNEVSKWTK